MKILDSYRRILTHISNFVLTIFGVSVCLSMVSCWRDKCFYVEEIDKEIKIIRINDDNVYRVYINERKSGNTGDYFDIKYEFSEPYLTICFPFEEVNKVYIFDECSQVERIKSSKFDMECIVKYTPTSIGPIEEVNEDEMNKIDKYYQLVDSIKLNSICIYFNSRFDVNIL